MSTGGDPPAATTILVGIIGGILLLAVVLVAQVLFYNVQRSEDEVKLYAVRPQELADLQAKQLAEISSYRYVDRAQGVVAVPIDRAIELYVAEQKAPAAPARMQAPERPPAIAPGQGQAP